MSTPSVSHRARRASSCALAAVLGLSLQGQEIPSGPQKQRPRSGFSTQVRFINQTSFRRVEWGRATVPFPQGVWHPLQTFHTAAYPSELIPFGAPWPDGSVRHAQLTVKLDLEPYEERLVEVRHGPPAEGSFTLSTWTARGLQRFGMWLAVTVPGGGTQLVALRPHSLLQSTAVRKRVLFRGRVPGTDLVYDLWLTLFSDADHAPFELRVTCSDASSQQWQQSVDRIDLWVAGAVAHVRGGPRRGAVTAPFTPAGPNQVRLLGAETLFDGQGQEWWGDLLFYHPVQRRTTESTPATWRSWRADTLAAVVGQPLFGVSTDWAASGAFGPFGHVPPPPPWVTDGGRAATLAERQSYEAWRKAGGGPWDDLPFGLLADPAMPGDQHDFGAAKLVQIFASGLPYGIEEARQNASEEALRPTHHREADASPVLAADHPRWVTWDGRTHFDKAVSPDRLGKPHPPALVRASGWHGRDNQHWSSLVLASAYLLTASPSLRYELDNEAELFIAGHTLPSQKPGWPTNNLGAARGVGRTMLSMSWNYLCTGRQDVHDRMVARAQEVVITASMVNRVTGPVRPIALQSAAPALLPRSHWRPWEESQAVLGLEACYRVTGSPWAHIAAATAARTLMYYGWKITPTETIIATAIGWKANGQPLTPQEYQDPTWVLWSYGTNFNQWALSSVKLAARYALMYNDVPLLVRSLYVYQELEKQRVKPRYACGWDRFSEWDAVK